MPLDTAGQPGYPYGQGKPGLRPGNWRFSVEKEVGDKEDMKRSRKLALMFGAAHSILPLLVLLRLFSISDGTERWANTLPLYFLDYPLRPIFLWFQDSPKIGESSFINTGISLVLGGLLYAAIGWSIGLIIDRKTKKSPTTKSTLSPEGAPSAPPVER